MNMIKTFFLLFVLIAAVPVFAEAGFGSAGGNETGDEIFRHASDAVWAPTNDDVRARALVDEGMARDPSHAGLKVLSAYLRMVQPNASCELVLAEVDKIMPPTLLDGTINAIRTGMADPSILFAEPEERKEAKWLVHLIGMAKGFCTHNLGQWEVSKHYLLVMEQHSTPLNSLFTNMLADDFMETNDYVAASRYYAITYDRARQEMAVAVIPSKKMDSQDRSEVALYNLAIAQNILGDQEGMRNCLKTLWNETPRRAYWLAKMKKDHDYVPILARKDVREILGLQ